jgi:hypothetical protein
MKIDNWQGWEPEWLRLTEHFLNAPEAPGAYIICADHEIGRAVGSDEHGILTIGESDNLRRRLAAFVRCARNPGVSGHMAGWRLITPPSKPFSLWTHSGLAGVRLSIRQPPMQKKGKC